MLYFYHFQAKIRGKVIICGKGGVKLRNKIKTIGQLNILLEKIKEDIKEEILASEESKWYGNEEIKIIFTSIRCK